MKQTLKLVQDEVNRFSVMQLTGRIQDMEEESAIKQVFSFHWNFLESDLENKVF